MEIDRLSKEELKSLCGELSTQIGSLTSKLERAIGQLNDNREERDRYTISLMTWVVENERSLPHDLYELAVEVIEKYVRESIESRPIGRDTIGDMSITPKKGNTRDGDHEV